ncbi:FAD/NAD(P)-binding domain-containing protein [Auriscalpium vulgare]|uniref:FAD/NAD(P)-binding domain-containing protein n=1 Tax=Auriscalpium vulgare TaxID=40419 RepID=A0ACB8RDW2_9AGAM|nr:FAD/NAD(P)-binding domain-containing protein [Auriscalpium vulgare]
MRVAVVGSGVSGLAASWLLNEQTDHEVHLYEADARPGGHANTVSALVPGYCDVDVDTGFIVLNPTTYPNFLRFLRSKPELTILPTEMTFSVSRDGGAFEWAGDGIRSVFCQPWRVFEPRMWRMLYDVLRFNACARSILKDDKADLGAEMSIGEYLQKEGYSDAFRDDYLLPMTAAVWSTPPDVCALDFPAKTLIRFLHNHHLLQITGKPSWLTIKGGSKKYVDTVVSALPASQLHVSTPIKSVSPSEHGGGVTLQTESGTIETFDHVIFACHSDQALRIINAGDRGATQDEQRILGGFEWSQNEVVLHYDEEFMPRSKLAWSCWNYLTTSGVDAQGNPQPNNAQVSLTYYMNALQHLEDRTYGVLLATLNPLTPPNPTKVLGRYSYAHPVLTARAVRLQAELPTIQNVRGLSFAGAWTRYGFHEDGFASGLRAALAVARGSGRALKSDIEVLDAERAHASDVGRLAGAFASFEGSGARELVGRLLVPVLLGLQIVVYWVLARAGGLQSVKGKSAKGKEKAKAD